MNNSQAEIQLIDELNEELDNAKIQFIENDVTVKLRRGPGVSDSYRCFIKKTDTEEMKRIVLRNCLSASRYDLFRRFIYKDALDCAVREYSARYGFSLKIDVNHDASIKYICPISKCHFVCQFTQRDGEYKLRYFHDHDTNKCSRYATFYVFYNSNTRYVSPNCNFELITNENQSNQGNQGNQNDQNIESENNSILKKPQKCKIYEMLNSSLEEFFPNEEDNSSLQEDEKEFADIGSPTTQNTSSNINQTSSNRNTNTISSIYNTFVATHLQPPRDKRLETIYEDNYISNPYIMSDATIETDELGNAQVHLDKEVDEYRKGISEGQALQEAYMRQISKDNQQKNKELSDLSNLDRDLSLLDENNYSSYDSDHQSVEDQNRKEQDNNKNMILLRHFAHSSHIPGTLFHYLYSEEPLLKGKTFRRVSSNTPISIDAFKERYKDSNLNICYISSKQIKSFFKCLNSTYIIKYLRAHQDEYAKYSFKEMLQILKRLFPNHGYRIRYYCLLNYYITIDKSFNYIPSIVNKLNHIGHYAFYMLHPKNSNLLQKLSSENQYNGSEIFVSKNIYNTIDPKERYKYIMDNNTNAFSCSTCFLSNMIKLFINSYHVIALNYTYVLNSNMKLIIVIASNYNMQPICLGFGLYPNDDSFIWKHFINNLKSALFLHVHNQLPIITFISEPNNYIQEAIQTYFPECPLIYNYTDYIIQHFTKGILTLKLAQKIMMSESEEEIFSRLPDCHDKRFIESLFQFWNYNRMIKNNYRKKLCPLHHVYTLSQKFLEEIQCYSGLQVHILYYCLYNYIVRTQISIKESLDPSLEYIPYYLNNVKLSKALDSHYSIAHDTDIWQSYLKDSEDTYIVDFHNLSCSCKNYQMTFLPCVHAILAYQGMYTAIQKINPNEAETFQTVFYHNVKYDQYYQQYLYFEGTLLDTSLFSIIQNKTIFPPIYSILPTSHMHETRAQLSEHSTVQDNRSEEHEESNIGNINYTTAKRVYIERDEINTAKHIQLDQLSRGNNNDNNNDNDDNDNK